MNITFITILCSASFKCKYKNAYVGLVKFHTSYFVLCMCLGSCVLNRTVGTLHKTQAVSFQSLTFSPHSVLGLTAE